MRRISTATTLIAGLACSPLSLHADMRQSVELAVQRYVDHCDLALSDPQAFLNASRDAGSDIVAQSATTPDGQALFALGTDSLSGAEIEIEIGAAGQKRLITCAFTSANFGRSATAAAAEAFLAYANAQPGWMTTGGQSPVAAFAGGDTPGAIDPESASFHYYIDGVLPKSGALTRLVVGWGNYYFEAYVEQRG